MALRFGKNVNNYLEFPANTFSNLLNGYACVSVHLMASTWAFDSVNNNTLFVGFTVGGVTGPFNVIISSTGTLTGGARSINTDGFQSFTTSIKIPRDRPWVSLGVAINFTGKTIATYIEGLCSGVKANATFTNNTYTTGIVPTQTDQIGSGGAEVLSGSPPLASSASQFPGALRNATIWGGTRTLMPGEFRALAQGADPRTIAPSMLKFYMPLKVGGEKDLISGIQSIMFGTLGAASDPIFIPGLWRSANKPPFLFSSITFQSYWSQQSSNLPVLGTGIN